MMLQERYRCRLDMTLIGRDSEVDFCRCIYLPFAPAVGHRLVINDQLSDYFDIDEADFHVETGEFRLRMTNNCGDMACPCGPGEDCCVVNIGFHINAGWNVGEVRTGFKRRVIFDQMFEPEKNFLTSPKKP